ncbi:CPBP family intramembrane glutamic endopeptidase [Isoptericola variabilis]|uniref:Abortive infection protein n=1 Tax=Isoptericola variabilis (strain 225) TaxID=743718 RepID=F6FQX2_ISOV2|nr:CPBP family intramembrane glutamic endopeptidase [Isoptericola variabilis]AEG43857.1 Abortive infection protein [Isoptericola variabilis 225]TWH34163.1 CAAX prenyl protease-like protein [Isoptericola variabilis J7]
MSAEETAAWPPAALPASTTPTGWAGPVAFVALAIALAWIVAIPVRLTGGLESPWFLPLSILMMLTPGAAALVVARFVDGEPRVWTRLGVVTPGSSWRRVLAWCAIALGVCLAAVVLALPVGAVLGVYPADFVGLSAFRAALDAQLEAAGAPPVEIPVAALLAGQLVTVVVGSVVNTLPALGEELGWRGYLVPRLLRLGTVPAILTSGVVWGVWHAPLLVLGYNYPLAPPGVAIAAMCGMTTVMGAVLAWVRLRSGSVWPAAVGHGTINAAAGLSLVLAQEGATVDTAQATILGWSGWILPAAFVVVLLVRGAFAAPSPSALRGAH